MSDTPHPAPRRPGLLRSGGVVAGMTLISRVLGFVRDQVLAIVFGAGGTTDVFLVAFKIPNFLRRLFGEGAFAQAFVPVFTEFREKKAPAELVSLAASVSGTLAVIVAGIAALGVIGAPIVISGFAPGFLDEPAKFDLAVKLLRITFPYLFWVSLVAYAGSMLNALGQFARPALAPVLLNLCMITAALVFAPYLDSPIDAMAWAVSIAGGLQLLMLLPPLRQAGLLPKPRWGLDHPGVRRILKLMGPALFGSSVAQISLLLDTLIASFLVAGSLSWLYYSDRLMEFPLGLLGVTIGTVILPRLSAEFSSANETDFRRTIDWALRLVILFGLPAALALMLLARPMVSTLFEYGAFTAADSRMTSLSLAAYAFGLPAFLLVKVFAPAFFSRQDTRTPVRIGVIALASNMAYNIALVVPLVLTDFVAPHIGLAIATVLSAWQQTLMLYRELKRQDIYQLGETVLVELKRAAWPMLAMSVVLLLFARRDWSALDGLARLLALLAIMGGGAAVYFCGLWLAGLRPRHLASH